MALLPPATSVARPLANDPLEDLQAEVLKKMRAWGPDVVADAIGLSLERLLHFAVGLPGPLPSTVERVRQHVHKLRLAP